MIKIIYVNQVIKIAILMLNFIGIGFFSLDYSMAQNPQPSYTDSVVNLAILSPDGVHIATSSYEFSEIDGFVKSTTLAVQNLVTGVQTIQFHEDTEFSSVISAIEWSRNGEFLFAAISNEIKKYNLLTGNTTTFQQAQVVDAFDLAPSGQYIAVTMRGGIIQIIDVSNGVMIREFSFNDNTIVGSGNFSLEHQMRWVGWSPDGTKLATVGRDLKIRIWDVQNLNIINEFEFPRGLGADVGLTSAAWSPDGTKLAVGGFYGLWIWSASTGQILQTIYQDTFISVREIKWHPFSNQFAAVRGGIIFFDGDTGNQLGLPIVDSRGTIESFDWSYTGNIVYGLSIRSNQGIAPNMLLQAVETVPPLPITPIVPSLTIFSQPTTTRIDTYITPSPSVQLVNTSGTPLAQAGISVTVALNAADANPVGTLSGTLTQLTDANGVATFPDLSIDLPGLKTLTFSAPDMPSLTSDPFLVYTPGSIEITHTDPNAGLKIADAPLDVAEGATIGDQFAVRLSDAPDADVTVSLSAPSDITLTPSSITFTPANFADWVVVNVSAAEDSTAEGTLEPTSGLKSESIPITLSASGDIRYEGLNETESANVYDVGVEFTPTGTMEVFEGSTVSYQLRLTAPPGVKAVGDSAETVRVHRMGYNNRLVTPTPTQLSFTRSNWMAWQTITVIIIDDASNRGASYVTSVIHELRTDVIAPLDSRYGGTGTNLANPSYRFKVYDND